jgi:hypothetical protein
MANEVSIKEIDERLCSWKKAYNDLKKIREPTFDEIRANLISITCPSCSGYNKLCAYYDGKAGK